LHKKVGDAWVIFPEAEMDEKPNMFGASVKPTSKRSFPNSEKKTKVRGLSVTDWGTPAEVREMSKMPHQITSRKEVEQAIEKIITKNGSEKRSFVKLTGRNGLNAVLRKSSIGKLVSNVQKKGMPFRVMDSRG
jgi:mevalonate kinase